jgi:exodeoxyribonuclease-3
MTATTIATWNVNSLRVRLPQLAEWVTDAKPDVLALQETKLPDADFPARDLEALGYRSVFSGQRTYNGVAILSRREIVPAGIVEVPGFPDEQRRVLVADTAGLRVVNLYVPNGQSPDSDKYRYKLGWLEALRAWLEGEVARHPNLVVLGDFNIAPTDADVHDPASWEGGVHVSPPERAALERITALGLVDVFRQFEQPQATFSWWDYRMGAFRRNHGLRIDLVLAHRELAPRCRECRVDREPRRAERPSDHAPVVATFDI